MGTILSVLILMILSILEIAARYPVVVVAFLLNIFLTKIIVKEISDRKNMAIMTVAGVNLAYVFGFYLLYLKFISECSGKMCGAAHLGILPYVIFGVLASVILVARSLKET